ncbi:MAG TPA: aminoglycoside phosphotransferase family protein [Pyrinomonadaceae bacterium]|nr:aminoglycoside phosphotransferase family protein [Pyrinomonadaceae bacterium]
MFCGLASPNLRDRVQQLARDWRLLIQGSFETETSVVSFVTRDNQSLVLKVIKQENDEWRAGEVLNAFAANGVPQVFEHTGGAMLLERLQPGNSLADLSLAGGDEEATEILAGVIGRMSPLATPDGCPKVEDWGKGFERYLATGDGRVPRRSVDAAQRVFAELCASQSRTRLLHGDLHHYNVLFDSQRGWLAIDPKGVIAEVEYEIGAILRNPFERPDLFLSRSTIERRIEQLTASLNLNRERVMGWAFAQAVLSAIWQIEDGFEVDGSNTSLKLAKAISPMLTVPVDVD